MVVVLLQVGRVPRRATSRGGRAAPVADGRGWFESAADRMQLGRDEHGNLPRVDFDEVAEELYGLDPGQFTPVRTAREKEARAAGDRDLAAQIKQIRKPSMSAWLANQLIRARRDQLEPLLELGEQLRELQASVSADQLRQFTQQRHQLVYALAREARGLGHERGVKISDDVARELEQTLHAALGDPQAAAALREGRLTNSLQYAGFGPVEALPSNGDAKPVPRRAPAPATKKDDLAARRERAEQLRQAREEAQEVLDRARTELTGAEGRRDETQQLAEDADRRAAEAREHVDQLRLDLDDAEEALAGAEYELKTARRNSDAARKAAILAGQRVTGAEHRLANVEPAPGQV